MADKNDPRPQEDPNRNADLSELEIMFKMGSTDITANLWDWGRILLVELEDIVKKVNKAIQDKDINEYLCQLEHIYNMDRFVEGPLIVLGRLSTDDPNYIHPLMGDEDDDSSHTTK